MKHTTGICLNKSGSWTSRIYENDKKKSTYIGSYKTKKEAVLAKEQFISKNYPDGYSADNYFHGMWGTGLYWTWNSMKSRCLNPKNQAYSYYGGRGIKICEEWKNFKNFMLWALTNGYQDDLTIDRIDCDGNYEPSNCKWSTRCEQQVNRRRSGKEGIYKYGRKYHARLVRNNNIILIGKYASFDLALIARNEYIKINYPHE